MKRLKRKAPAPDNEEVSARRDAALERIIADKVSAAVRATIAAGSSSSQVISAPNHAPATPTSTPTSAPAAAPANIAPALVASVDPVEEDELMEEENLPGEPVGGGEFVLGAGELEALFPVLGA